MQQPVDTTKYPYRPGDPYDPSATSKQFINLNDVEKAERKKEVSKEVEKYRKIAAEFDKKAAQDALQKKVKEQEEEINRLQEQARAAEEAAKKAAERRTTLLAAAASLGLMISSAYMYGKSRKTLKRRKRHRNVH